MEFSYPYSRLHLVTECLVVVVVDDDDDDVMMFLILYSLCN